MSALEVFNLSATKRYLQSVVFVDDNIFDKGSGMPMAVPEVKIPTRKTIFRRKATDQPGGPPVVNPTMDNVNPYRAKDMVSSFAKEGIICALYEPSPGFATDKDSEIYKLCERPDIIILDWDFAGDQGKKARLLISALVKHSQASLPHHVRLLSVYTSDPSLTAVSNSVFDTLTKAGLEARPIETSNRIQSGSVRLLILGKPIQRFGTDEEKFTIEEKDLAATLIREFAMMNSGLLPSVALHGLAAIRRNSKRILDRFHGDLDGAFLLHRAMVASSEEAFHQLPEVLAEEIRAVIEDEKVPEPEAKSISEAASASLKLGSNDKSALLLAQQSARAGKILEKLKVNGKVSESNQRLASLFSSRTHYAQDTRTMGFGTIVRFRAKKSAPWKFAICLVPACDSLRLDLTIRARFPFWTLQENVYSGGKKGRRGFVLDLFKEGLISLTASGSAGDMFWTDTFSVNKPTKTAMAKLSQGAFRFKGARRRIEWVGQLKPLHAHRIAHDITEDLSRVGVTEADWIRAICSVE